MTDTLQSRVLHPKRVAIGHDYRVSSQVLGLGINGKVLECYSKADGRKYALKVSNERMSSVRYILMLLINFLSYLCINVHFTAEYICSTDIYFL